MAFMKFPKTNKNGECLCVACCDARGKKIEEHYKGEIPATMDHLQDYLNMNFRYGCEICGNKRCPHHRDHKFKCTDSNQPGQKGVLSGQS